jgi:heme oxygenase
MLTDELREETKTNHQLLEKKLITRMRAMRNRSDYAHLLSVFYGYMAGLEKQISLHLNDVALPDYNERRKASALEADIKTLGGQLPPVASIEYLPKIETHLQAIGALYVMEGSTLGGQIITQMISKQLSITEGLSFFESYGDQTMAMWQRFKNMIDLAENLPGIAVIDSANQTFEKFGNWFDLNP